jgi:Leucine-rich repeat (LRR) protein
MKKKKVITTLIALAGFTAVGLFASNLANADELGDIPVNETYFPDKTFRKFIENQPSYVVDVNSGEVTDRLPVDQNQDGILSQAERDNVQSIAVGVDENDLTGIKYLTGLKSFSLVTGTFLKTLDFSENVNLNRVVLSGKKLEKLVLPENGSLTEFLADYCPLLSDVQNLDKQTKLTLYSVTYVPYFGQNKLYNELMPDLKEFRMTENDGNSEIDVSQNTKLTNLALCSCDLPTLDLSNNNQLQTLNLDDTPVSSIKINPSENLENLYIPNTKLTNFNFGDFPNLSEVDCGKSPFKSVDLSKNTKLNKIYFPWCNLEEIKFADENPYLAYVQLNSNDLKEVNLSNMPNLQDIKLSNNQLATIDLSNNLKLTNFSCSSNELTNLDISSKVLDVCYVDNNHLRNVTLPEDGKTLTYFVANEQTVEAPYSQVNGRIRVNLMDIYGTNAPQNADIISDFRLNSTNGYYTYVGYDDILSDGFDVCHSVCGNSDYKIYEHVTLVD